MISGYIILGLVAACAITGVILCLQIKRAGKAEAEAARLHDAFWQVARKAEALQTARKQTTQITEEANAKRQKLNTTADSDLVSRANDLFGVRDGRGGNNGGN
jgi:biopolymer transport protein ExbB/TolQ